MWLTSNEIGSAMTWTISPISPSTQRTFDLIFGCTLAMELVPGSRYFLMGLGVSTDESFKLDRYATRASISWSVISSLYLSGICFLLYSFSNPSAIQERGLVIFSFISSGFMRLPMLSIVGPRFFTEPLPPILWQFLISLRSNFSFPNPPQTPYTAL